MVRSLVGGVDTHADVHVAAAVDHNGGLLGIDSFPADQAGYEELLGWLVGFGEVEQIGRAQELVRPMASSTGTLPSRSEWQPEADQGVGT